MRTNLHALSITIYESPQYMWEVYYFDVCGTYLVYVILICLVFFYILRFLTKCSVCALYVLIDIILIGFF